MRGINVEFTLKNKLCGIQRVVSQHENQQITRRLRYS